MKKYICQYYGWIPSYGDWDCDDFIIIAKNKKEASDIMNKRLKNKFLKGEPSLMLYSTYQRQMKEWEQNNN
jgi:predicted membrane-bound spermidine synthase